MKTTIDIQEYYAMSNSQGYKQQQYEAEKANILIQRINIMLNDFIRDTGYSEDILISSGHRTEKYNRMINGAEKSLHISSQAVDLMDCTIAKWYISKGVEYWQNIKLSVEHYNFTKGKNKGWSHFDVLARKDKTSKQTDKLIYRDFYPK